MSTKFVFEGLEELKKALQALPDELTDEAREIVRTAATDAAEDIKAAYPVRTGNLRSHVFVTQFDRGRLSTGFVVKNTAKHANIFESGSQARHTAIGANRGAMPPGHVFVPRVIRYRRRMWAGLKAMLVAYGLVVSGDA